MSTHDQLSPPAPAANEFVSAAGSGEPRDHAILMAYDAFRICMGSKPQYASCETVMRWMALMSDKPLVRQLNGGVTYPPHEFKPHKKYPWFCRDCGYPPRDELKHIQHPDWTPAAFLNTCGNEPIKETP